MTVKKGYGFDNGLGTSMSKGLHFLSYPVIEYGSENIESISIAGRKGALLVSKGDYTDTKIINKIEFVSKAAELSEIKRIELIQWLKKTKKVSYTDMEDCFFKVKKVEINDTSRKYKAFGNITVTFICDPGIYLKSGDYEIQLHTKNNIYNAYSVCSPIYKIIGNGTCILTVNGKTMKATVGQNLTIDTDRMIAYREDEIMMNTSVNGDYEDLYLKPGDNNIGITSGFRLKIIPNWRRL